MMGIWSNVGMAFVNRGYAIARPVVPLVRDTV